MAEEYLIGIQEELYFFGKNIADNSFYSFIGNISCVNDVITVDMSSDRDIKILYTFEDNTMDDVFYMLIGSLSFQNDDGTINSIIFWHARLNA